MTKKMLSWLGVGFVILSTFVVLELSQRDGMPSSLTTGNTVGSLAPDFTGQTLDNQEVSLQDFRGKTVFVNLFASWCGPCLVETPHLVSAYQDYQEEVIFLGVNLQEPPGAIAGYQQDFDIQYLLLQDPEGRFVDLYAPRGLPTSWVIDKEGVIRYIHVGPISQVTIQNVLDTVR